MTIVPTDIALGLSVDMCHKDFYYDFNLKCCTTDSGIDIQQPVPDFVGLFYAFNADMDNISVQQHWLTNSSLHYHTDLGLAISSFNSSIRVRLLLIAKTCHTKFFYGPLSDKNEWSPSPLPK